MRIKVWADCDVCKKGKRKNCPNCYGRGRLEVCGECYSPVNDRGECPKCLEPESPGSLAGAVPARSSAPASNHKRGSSMPSLAENFAANLKAQRQRKKLSQEALAAKANFSVSYISMLERNQRTPPLDTLEQLATALSVSPVSLLS